MFVGNDLIDSMYLDPEKIALPGYISFLTRELKDKHPPLLESEDIEPEFLVAFRNDNHKKIA